jgi:hypothetical protein
MSVGGSAVGGSDGVGLGLGGWACSARVDRRGRDLRQSGRIRKGGWWIVFLGNLFRLRGYRDRGDLVGPVAAGSGRGGSTVGGIDVRVFCSQ